MRKVGRVSGGGEGNEEGGEGINEGGEGIRKGRGYQEGGEGIREGERVSGRKAANEKKANSLVNDGENKYEKGMK